MADQTPILRSCLIGLAVLAIQWSVVPRPGYQDVIIRSEDGDRRLPLPLNDPRLVQIQERAAKFAAARPPSQWHRETVAIQWQAEVASLYADREKQRSVSDPVEDSDGNTEIAAQVPAALRSTQLAGHRMTGVGGPSSGWVDYWSKQSSLLQNSAVGRQTAWLQWKESQVRRFQLGTRFSGPISPRQFAWMVGVAALTGLLTWIWIVTDPRRTVSQVVLRDSDGVVADLADGADFLTIRQSWPVWLRSCLGWTLTGIAAISLVWNPWNGI